MKITEATWMFLDTETTGIPKTGEPDPRIIELGWVIIKTLQVEGGQDFLINPGEPIPEKVVQITHITDEMVAGKPKFDGVAETFFKDFERVDFIAAYNAKFDKQMLDFEFAQIGSKLPEKIWLDPLIWSRTFLKTTDHKLATMAKQFNVSLENAHRADADAAASAEIMMKFFSWGVDEANFPDDVEQLKDLEQGWLRGNMQTMRLNKTIKNNSTGTPGQVAQNVYDNYNRDRLMKLGNRGRYGK
jgi:DNA polymerase-3 subunit alpha (Gram-positive type)